MRTIEIDDDLYAFIASQTKEIGESAGDILRRILGGPIKHADKSTSAVAEVHELVKVLENPAVKFKPGVEKFLYILGEASKIKPDSFEKILSIQGRGRKYFAASRSEIESSGNSTQPKQIPGTRYWAMTNSPTSQKAMIMRQVLEAVGFTREAALAAARAVDGRRRYG